MKNLRRKGLNAFSAALSLICYTVIVIDWSSLSDCQPVIMSSISSLTSWNVWCKSCNDMSDVTLSHILDITDIIDMWNQSY